MVKLALLALITFIGIGGSLSSTPFIGVSVYYLFATLRPQYLWEWDLPQGIQWSFYVAMAAIFGTFVWKVGEWIQTGRRQRLPSPPHVLAHGFFFLFAIWIVITYFTAEDQQVAQEAFIEYLKIFVMYGVATVVITTIRQIWILYLIVTGSLCYIALEMNQIYHIQGYLKVYRTGFGGLDNNGAGLMLAMGVPLCLFAWDGIRHWSRWGFLLMIPVIIEAVLTSFSRGAMVSILASVPLYFLRCTRKRQLAVMMTGLAIVVLALAGNEVRERFFSVEKFQSDDSANSRLTSWAIAWQMANEHPFFGFGIRNSNRYTFSYGADMDGRTIHSQYLQIAADSGLMALGLYLLAITSFAFAVRAARKTVLAQKQLDTELTYDQRLTILMANGVESAILVFCVGGVFLSLENFELPYVMMLLGAQLWAVTKAKEYRNSVNPLAEVYSQLARQLPPKIVRSTASPKAG